MKKKNYLYLSMLAAAATFSACSSSDDIATDGTDSDGNNYTYMKISLSDPVTRGDTREVSFNNASKSENAISSLRLFFFDENGNKYSVNSKGTNSIDVPKSDLEESKNVNYEGATSTSVARTYNVELQVKSGSAYPAKLVAIANYPTTTGGVLKALPEDASLSDLTKFVSNQYAVVTDSNFVMSNSVYVDNNAVVNYKALVNANFNTTASSATAAEVYVERVLAKVKTTFADALYTSNAFSAIQLTSDGTTNMTYDDGSEKAQDLYLKVNGWNLVQTDTCSYLIKNLSASYDGLEFANSETVSDVTNHRSYWANSVAFGDNNVANYVSFEGADKSNDASVYCQENTPTTTDSTKCTKLLVTAQLGKMDNSSFIPVGLAKWRGTLYDSLTCKKRIIGSINNRIQVADDNKGKNAKQATLTDASVYYADAKLADKRYIAKLVVNGLTALPTTGYYKVDGGEWTAVKESGANVKASVDSLLVNQTKEGNAGSTSDYYVQYFNDGMTYYYTIVKHLGKEGKLGEYGIVRNHSYTISVQGLQGTGTPVPDEGKDPIIPQKPEDDVVTYMKAKINVNSWRIVPEQEVTLK